MPFRFHYTNRTSLTIFNNRGRANHHSVLAFNVRVSLVLFLAPPCYKKHRHKVDKSVKEEPPEYEGKVTDPKEFAPVTKKARNVER